MLDKVKELIKKTLKRGEIVITEDTNIIDDLELNSLELAELIYAFEDAFGIEIPDRAISKFRVVGDIIAYLEKNTAN